MHRISSGWQLRAGYNVLRSGSFGYWPGYLRVSMRIAYAPSDTHDYLGIRCCRSPAP